jgi:hypothetical protein
MIRTRIKIYYVLVKDYFFMKRTAYLVLKMWHTAFSRQFLNMDWAIWILCLTLSISWWVKLLRSLPNDMLNFSANFSLSIDSLFSLLRFHLSLFSLYGFPFFCQRGPMLPVNKFCQPRCPTANEWMKKIWYLYQGILLSHEEKWNYVICR